MPAALRSKVADRLRATLVRPGRRPGLRTAKSTLAAVLSFVIAQRLHTSALPMLAPLTALLVIQLTMYETLTSGLQRIASVLAGVLVAVAVASFVGLTWWSLGGVIALSLVLGRLLRLGGQLLEVPISAMLVLAVGGAQDATAGRARVVETLIGAATGIVVNAIIAPPLHVQPADAAVSDLAGRMARFLQDLSAQLRGGWSRAAALHWLDAARALGSEVAHADRTLARAEQSTRFNPRQAEARQALPRLRIGLTGLEHCQVTLRSVCRSLLDRTFFVPPEEESTVYDSATRAALADVLEAAANGITRVVPVTSALGPPEAARDEVGDAMLELLHRRDHLRNLLSTIPHSDDAAWQQHGSLLAAVDQLRVEVEAAVRPPEEERHPRAIIDGSREAVRHLLDVGVTGPRERHRRRRRRA
ncbi:MAG: aromatic acid exporter family protein [Candidatus Dormibacteraeota bacterium]|nr:aromatic acid exporter family protein [Candidatus Dormibacteraeota bacterium]